MPGLNILSVIPGTAGDVSASQAAPKLPPQQSFAQVQARMSSTMDPQASSPPANTQGSNASSDPGSPSQATQGRADTSPSPNAPTEPSDGSSQSGQGRGDSEAKTGASSNGSSHQTDAGHGQDADKVARQKAKADKDKAHQDDRKTDRKADHAGQGGSDPTVAAAQSLTLTQRHGKGGSGTGNAESVALIKGAGARGSGKKRAATADAKQDRAGGKSPKDVDGEASVSSTRSLSGTLEQLLEKAVAQGAKNGKGVAKREGAAGSSRMGDFARQLRLQDTVGESLGVRSPAGTSGQLVANTATTATSGQNAATAGTGPNAYATSVDLPVQHAKWGEQIAGKVTWLANQHIQVADIHVNPPDLGPVHVQMHLHNDHASVTMHSQHPGVRDMLEANGQRLRDMMQQGGFTLSHFDVSSQGGQQQQNQQQSTGAGSGFAGSAHHIAGLSASAEVEPVRGGSLTLGWNRLDLYA